MLRIIGGKAKGRLLKVPSGTKIRPTSDKVRESLFNIIGPYSIIGARFMDIFAGSGAVGLEALSRGADYVTFIDSYPHHIKVIRDNLDKCGFREFAEIFCDDAFSSLERISKSRPAYNIVYADPPYRFHDWKMLLLKITVSVKISDYGFLIIEHASRVILPEGIIDIPLYGHYRYGDSTLTVYRKGN